MQNRWEKTFLGKLGQNRNIHHRKFAVVCLSEFAVPVRKLQLFASFTFSLHDAAAYHQQALLTVVHSMWAYRQHTSANILPLLSIKTNYSLLSKSFYNYSLFLLCALELWRKPATLVYTDMEDTCFKDLLSNTFFQFGVSFGLSRVIVFFVVVVLFCCCCFYAISLFWLSYVTIHVFFQHSL